jgi:hypothetical protein
MYNAHVVASEDSDVDSEDSEMVVLMPFKPESMNK